VTTIRKNENKELLSIQGDFERFVGIFDKLKFQALFGFF